MTDVTPKTLFIPMFQDFVEDTRDETNRWYDLDHVPQRLTCPGFLHAERYELVRTGPGGALRYLNVYYVESPEVLRSEAYRCQVAAHTPWAVRRTGLGVSGTYLRGVWVQQPVRTRSAHLAPGEGPRTWWLRTHDVDGEDVAAISSWPGVLGAERYASVEVDLPGPPGEPPPRYMTIYDLDTPEAVTTPGFPWLAADGVSWQGVYLQRPSPWTIRPSRAT
jgi:hypothetical protein